MERKRGKKPRRRPGSARRPKAVKGRWRNMPNGKRVDVCGEIMRVGSQIVEIPAGK